MGRISKKFPVVGRGFGSLDHEPLLFLLIILSLAITYQIQRNLLVQGKL